MSIWITGDTHGTVTRFSTENFPEQKEMNKKEDYVVVLGDFGMIWDFKGESQREAWWLDWLEEKPFTTLFIDGNHECINQESDVLTEKGWMNIQDAYHAENLKIANVNLDTGKIMYDFPLNKTKVFSEKIIDIKGSYYKQSVTPNHDVILDGKKRKASDLLHQDIWEEQLKFSVLEDEKGIALSPKMIEILTTIVLSATIVDYKKHKPNYSKLRIQYHLKKQQKIDYITNLLNDSNVPYTLRYGKDHDVFICIYEEHAGAFYKLLDYKKEFPRYFSQMNKEQFQHLLYALSQMGEKPINDKIVWHATSLSNINLVQELCIKHNCDIQIKQLENASKNIKRNTKPQYICYFNEDKHIHQKVIIQERDYHDYAYCFTMPQGTLITRYEYGHCVTGNCFDRLYQYPVKEWNGGLVHEIRPSVLHLMRGQVYEINEKKIFTFGGASSHDIDDGILDIEDPDFDKKYEKLRNKPFSRFRINHISWWERELPSDEEMKEGLKNLKRYNNEVDFIFTHCPYTSLLSFLDGGTGEYKPDILSDYLQQLKETINYKAWLFGHFHINKTFYWDNSHCLYEQIIRIA